MDSKTYWREKWMASEKETGVVSTLYSKRIELDIVNKI